MFPGMTRMRSVFGFALVGLSCAAHPVPRPGAALEVSVRVQPTDVVTGDSVTVTVRVVNPGTTPRTLQFRNTCVVTFEIRTRTDRLVAPHIMCGQAITDHVFPAGDTMASFRIVIGSPDYQLDPGTYRVVGGLGSPMVAESEPVTLTVGVGED